MNEIEQDIRNALMSSGDRRFKISRVANWLMNYPDEHNSVYAEFGEIIRKGCEIADASRLLKVQAELLGEYNPEGDGKFSVTAIYRASLAQGGGALTDLIREVERKRKGSGYAFCEACIDDSKPAPSSSGEPDVVAGVESKEARQARRHQLCITAGLMMPTDTYSSMPRGIGELAKNEGITRQSFTEDVKAHIGRLHGR